MSFLTPKEAAEFPCPLARVHGDGSQGKCRAGACIIWRWRRTSDLVSAVNREMACLAQDEAKKSGQNVQSEQFHDEALARVSNDPAAFGVQIPKDFGYCGLGGVPT